MSKDPYVYDDTNVLKNLANIKEQHKLDDYETTMVNLGIIKLLKSDIEIVKVNDTFFKIFRSSSNEDLFFMRVLKSTY